MAPSLSMTVEGAGEGAEEVGGGDSTINDSRSTSRVTARDSLGLLVASSRISALRLSLLLSRRRRAPIATPSDTVRWLLAIEDVSPNGNAASKQLLRVRRTLNIRCRDHAI